MLIYACLYIAVLEQIDVLVTIASVRKKRKNLGLHQLEVWGEEKEGQVLVSFSGAAAGTRTAHQ